MPRVRAALIIIVLLLTIAASSYAFGQNATPTGENSEAMWEDFNPANFTNPTNIDNQWLTLNTGPQPSMKEYR